MKLTWTRMYKNIFDVSHLFWVKGSSLVKEGYLQKLSRSFYTLLKKKKKKNRFNICICFTWHLLLFSLSQTPLTLLLNSLMTNTEIVSNETFPNTWSCCSWFHPLSFCLTSEELLHTHTEVCQIFLCLVATGHRKLLIGIRES